MYEPMPVRELHKLRPVRDGDGLGIASRVHRRGGPIGEAVPREDEFLENTTSPLLIFTEALIICHINHFKSFRKRRSQQFVPA